MTRTPPARKIPVFKSYSNSYTSSMLRSLLILFVFPLLFILSACTGEKTPRNLAPDREENSQGQVPELDRYSEEASLIASSMDDALLAAQCLLTGIDTIPFFSDFMKSILQEIPAGGIMLFRYNLTGSKDEISLFLKDLSDFIGAASGILPFMAVDHEGGLVQRFGKELTWLPAPFSFWEMAQIDGEAVALKAVEDLSRLSGEELWDLGIDLNLAPVVEVLSPDNQAFLGSRSYGPDPGFTEKAASAFIRGMGTAGIACTIKHFPGNSAADPHYGHSEINADRPTLDTIIKPFYNIIQELHVPVLMVSHAVVTAIDAERNGSLSPALITGWLREELEFSGIVLADDFSMQAVAARGISAEEAAIQALNAGVDMIMCWPSNIASIHEAILLAVQEDRLPRQRLLEAAERVIAEKLRSEELRFGLIPLRDSEEIIP